MTDSANRAQDLVSKLIDAQKTYTSLRFDDESSGTPRPPATSQQIDELERAFGRPLPTSYKDFLTVHNGIDQFHADGVLMGTEHHSAQWVDKRVASVNKNWQDVIPNPFKNGALQVMMGPDIQHFVVIASDRFNEDGEPLFVEYDQSAEVRTFDDLYSLIEAELETLAGMIDLQRHGSDL